MPKICYVSRSFAPSSRELIDKANAIIDEYEAQGFDLTLRQLYYQMVARDFIANKVKEYNRLKNIVSDARLAGLIDWNRIVDLTRELRQNAHWESPESIVGACAEQYAIDKWEDQPHRVEVWVEKDALRNVVERACTAIDVPFFVCRGYTSQSEMWSAAQRFIRWSKRGQEPIIFHLGDHDPSGIDMSRDIQERLNLFGADVDVRRIALNMPQIEEFEPPPNPAKETDSRFAAYMTEYGDESWELDALSPETLDGLIRRAVTAVLNKKRWKEAQRREADQKAELESASTRWDEVRELLDG